MARIFGSRSGKNASIRSEAGAAQLSASKVTEDKLRIEGFQLERYRYILQQIHTANENVYRFLAIYQALAVALVSGGVTLFVGYRKWGIPTSVARSGILGLMVLLSIVAAFTVMLIVIGVASWLDYRREECELTDSAVYPGFRKPPTIQNFLRWYETYVIFFIAISAMFLWMCTLVYVLPAMNLGLLRNRFTGNFAAGCATRQSRNRVGS
jgi:small-conductance mechanosensitive channel